MPYYGGEQRPPYSGRGEPGRGGGAPPGMTPWPGPPPGQPAVVYRAQMPTLHQGAYQPGAAQVVYRAPYPGAPPLGAIRAPPASPSPDPAPYKPAQVAAPQAAAPSPSSSSSAPSAAALAKEVEQKLFATETSLAPPAAAESAAAALVSKKGPAHPERPGYGAARKVMIRADIFLQNVVDINLFH
uniref:Uncharacterized protein n=1 Tax=Oryza punctata TaxID=4537 RepID=A0A0E0KGX8_ORYPU